MAPPSRNQTQTPLKAWQTKPIVSCCVTDQLCGHPQAAQTRSWHARPNCLRLQQPLSHLLPCNALRCHALTCVVLTSAALPASHS